MAFVASTSAKSPASSVALPGDVQEGDNLYLFVSAYGPASIATPAGWTLVDSVTDLTFNNRGAIFHRVVGEDEPSSVTVSAPGQWYLVMILAAYRGEVLSGEWVFGGVVSYDVAVAAGESAAVFGYAGGVGLFTGDGFTPQPQDWLVGGSPAWTFWHGTAPGPISDEVHVQIVDSSTSHPLTMAWWWLAQGGGGSPPTDYPPAPKEDPEFTAASLYRVRSNLSVDVGSVIAATAVKAVEAGVSEDFPMDVELGSNLHQFIEALDPENPTLAYYPSPVQNNEWLNTYEGETNLGRMASVYPRRIFGTVYDLSGEVDASWTATEAIAYIFSQWALDHAWFRYGVVPDLRFARPDGTYTGTLGQLSTDLIAIPQTRQSRQTMREIIDEWLSAFPGAVVTEDETGSIVIVPRDGPDADSSPYKTLTNYDAYSITQGPGDPRNTVNGCTVTNRPWTVEEDVSVLQPAWFQIRTAAGRSLTQPGSTLDLTTNSLLGATGQPSLWPLSNPDDTLAFGVLSWTDPDTSDLLITGHVRYWDLGAAGIDKTNNTVDDPGDLAFDNVNDLPLDGDWHAVFRLRRVFSWVGSTYDYWVAFDARFDSELGGVQFRTSGSKFVGPFVDALTWWSQGQASFAVTLDGLANRYGRSVTNSATFNRFSGELIGPDGTNAMQASVEQYGEREATINIGIFNVPVDDLMGIAQAHVLRNINPKIERVIDQSVWNAFPLKFVDAGRLVALPSGEEGIVISRGYSDDYGISYSNGTLSSQARIEVLDPDSIIVDPDPDTLDDYLLLDSGEVWSIDHPNSTLAALGLTVPSEVN